MSQYISLAGVYDGLTADVPYGAFAGFYEKVFSLYGIKPQIVLDMACGTGTLTSIMADRGFEMIGVDASEEMLAVAYEKTEKCSIKPLLLCQRLEDLDLYGTVGAAVSSLDCLNYIHSEKLAEVFRKMHLFIEPGGVLVFDILMPEALEALDGQVFIDENDETFCVWRTEYDYCTKSCRYGMDVFVRNGDMWERSFEEHIEYAHSVDTVVTLLKASGFDSIKVFDAGSCLECLPAEDKDRRSFIAARRTIDDGGTANG